MFVHLGTMGPSSSLLPKIPSPDTNTLFQHQPTTQQDWGAVLSLFRNLQKDLYHPTAPMCHAALKAALALNDLGTAVAAMKTLVREGWNFGRWVAVSHSGRVCVYVCGLCGWVAEGRS